MAELWRVRELEVIAANFKRRHTGVTSTVVALLPVQGRAGEGRKGVRIAALGPGLPERAEGEGGAAGIEGGGARGEIPKTTFGSLLWEGWTRPAGRRWRIWHARRNNELLAGWVLKAFLRMPLKLVFTSAAQRDHTGWTKFLLRRADAVIATSPESASFLKVPHVVNMHGVDPEVYKPAADGGGRAAAWAETRLPGKYGIGIFGRVRSQKGTDRFVAAMCELLPKFTDWTAVIVGAVRPEQRGFAERLKGMIAAAGLEERVRFIGEVSPEEVPVWQRRMTVVVSPQRWEGFGLVPAEAMASGAAVVATRVGAAAHLIEEGRTGYLVEAENTAGLRGRLEKLMAEPGKAEEMGRNGREHVLANFTVEREAAGIERVYEGVWGG